MLQTYNSYRSILHEFIYPLINKINYRKSDTVGLP